MNLEPTGPGWAPVPAKMSKRHPEWRHKDRRLTVTVYEAQPAVIYALRPSVLAGRSSSPASVSVSTSKPKLTEDDAAFVRNAFALGDSPVKWTPGGKGRRCTITEVQA